MKYLENFGKSLKTFENFSYLDRYKILYRWVGQAGLFQYFYGDMPPDVMRHYVLNTGKMPKLPPLKPLMEISHFEDDNGAICMTVDPHYMGEPYNGECIIRINLDMEQMVRKLDKSKFVNLLNNGESEIRYTDNIPNWTDYLIKIDLLTEAFEDGFEDDFGDYRAIQQWFPKEFKHMINLFDDESAVND